MRCRHLVIKNKKKPLLTITIISYKPHWQTFAEGMLRIAITSQDVQDEVDF